MYSPEFEKKIEEKLFQILPQNLMPLSELPFYEFKCSLLSDTHKFTLNNIREFNDLYCGFYKLEFINENTLTLTIRRLKSTFQSKDSTFIYRVFSGLVDDFCIGLSIITFGRIYWHKMDFVKRRFLTNYDSETMHPFPSSIDYYPHPVGYNEKNELHFNKMEGFTSFELRFASFWTIVRKGKKWDQVSNNYRKALLLSTLPQFDYSFYDEIFMLYYKSVENILSIDILQKEKLENELRSLIDALSKLGLKEFDNEFRALYIFRGKIGAHQQKSKIEFITYEHIHDIKLFSDSILAFKAYESMLKLPETQRIEAVFLRTTDF